MQVKILVEGGDMKPGPTLSQKLGPLGINIGQVIQKVNEITKNFKGLKVPVELDIDISTKDFDIKVFSPPVSELLKKELGIEKGSGEQGKIKVANASIEQIISVAKTKLPYMLSKDLKAAVKTVLGSCASLGILVENQSAAHLGHQIEGGKFQGEIKEEKTETPEDKKAELEEFFEEVKEEQEKIIKQEEAEKAAAEAETPTEETGEKKPEEEEKKEEKKT